MTSSVRGVVPITRADGEPIGDGKPGPITRRRVMHAYDALVARRAPSAPVVRARGGTMLAALVAFVAL